jgi:hypothetical protein
MASGCVTPTSDSGCGTIKLVAAVPVGWQRRRRRERPRALAPGRSLEQTRTGL